MRETESNNKVLLGMSGGTDSSVAALPKVLYTSARTPILKLRG